MIHVLEDDSENVCLFQIISLIEQGIDSSVFVEKDGHLMIHGLGYGLLISLGG